MKKIDKMLKCRALFLQGVAYLTNENIDLDENFNLLLENFIENYFIGNEEYFNLIYYFDIDEEGNLKVMEDPAWSETLSEYLGYFNNGNSEAVKKIYDDIGQEDVNKISILTEQFVNHIIVLNDMNNNRIKS